MITAILIAVAVAVLFVVVGVALVIVDHRARVAGYCEGMEDANKALDGAVREVERGRAARPTTTYQHIVGGKGWN